MLDLFFACFTGEMLLRSAEGKKRADAIEEGDLLWSRDEFDADGPLVLKRVVRRFERTAKIWQVRVAGQVLRTTLEHPFWVENRRSWLPVGELRVGDVVRTEEGALLAVEGIEDSGSWEKVYNWEVEDYHTYFVSATEDAPSIWAHNAKKCVGGSEEESTVAGSVPKGRAAASGGAAKGPKSPTNGLKGVQQTGPGNGAPSPAPNTKVYPDGSVRTSDGKFAGATGTVPGTPGALQAENTINARPGWRVVGKEISVRDADGTLRRYDLVAQDPQGNNVGIEVKSGSATRTPAQRRVDNNLNANGGFDTVGERAADAGIDFISRVEVVKVP